MKNHPGQEKTHFTWLEKIIQFGLLYLNVLVAATLI
jgi:hypothetical protein